MKTNFWKKLLWSVLDLAFGMFTEFFKNKKNEVNGN